MYFRENYLSSMLLTLLENNDDVKYWILYLINGCKLIPCRITKHPNFAPPFISLTVFESSSLDKSSLPQIVEHMDRCRMTLCLHLTSHDW